MLWGGVGCAGKDLWWYEIGSIPEGDGDWGVGSRRSQMADRTLSSAGVPEVTSILGFMTLSAAEAGLICCPLRCLAAGIAFTLQTYSSVSRSAVV